MVNELTLRIILQKPTPGVVFGLQKGKGNNYETVQKQTANSNDLMFEFIVEAKLNDNNDLVVLGPFAQGPPKERFVYIDIGTCAGQTGSPWSRRLKIPLAGIDSKVVNKATGKII